MTFQKALAADNSPAESADTPQRQASSEVLQEGCGKVRERQSNARRQCTHLPC
ncbi:hypothetical protein HMPREF9141_1244 [Prevotella multiformis DSM 16608]|uniref:Uncharacterized protein n=1 Tax=Prevotella multiformis DSM 16608 TaxID=888743 RepID=F0F6M2_9BACT|nr:hypothetical protein HMPREF9141_1244 [Prevotella multiformis DSM 16608]